MKPQPQIMMDLLAPQSSLKSRNSTPMLRRVFLGALAASAVRGAHAGLSDLVARVTGGEAAGRLSVVLIDVTASVSGPDWTLYERAFEALLKTNVVGDHVVLASIGDRPVSKFIAQADRTITVKHKRLEDETSLKRVNAQLVDDFLQIKAAATKPAKATYILDAISATDQLFEQARARRQALTLVVLSDMIEESPVANFARGTPDTVYTTKLIEKRRNQGLLPDLHGVRVHVAGAGGKNGEQMARVQAFWSTFFSATRAELKEYGRNPGSVSR